MRRRKFLASSSGFLTDWSTRMMTLFFRELTISGMMYSLWSKKVGFLEYRAIRGPSYSTLTT